jgi:hypothetical protein
MVSIGIRIGIPQGTGGGGGSITPSVATPSITSPTEAASDQAIDLTVTASAFAVTNEGSDTHASSDWQFATDSGFSNVVEESLADTSNKTSYTATLLDAGTTYYVRVRYNGTTYGASGWSTAVSFSVAYVSTPSITSPSDSATDVSLSPTFTSSAFATSGDSDTHAESDWQLASDSGFSTIIEESLNDASNLTSWSPAGALDALTTYYVRVGHTGTDYGDSAWSATVSFTTADAPAYDTDAQAFFDAMGTAPNDAVKTAVDDLITTLKSDGIWSQLDALWPLNMPTLADSLLNMKDPTGTAATAVNSPTHTPYVGIASDYSSKYVDTNFVPSTDGVQFTASDACIGLHNATERTFTTQSLIGGRGTGNDRIILSPMTSTISNRATWYLNSGTLDQGNVQTSAIGFSGYQRSNTATQYWRDGALAGTDASLVEASLIPYSLYIGTANFYGSPAGFTGTLSSCAYVGAYLGTDLGVLHTRLATFRTAMAAAAP